MRKSSSWAWTSWVTAGECVGFAIPALVGAFDVPPWILVVAGCLEGAVLGWAQAHVLRRFLVGFTPRAWILATSLGAGFTWAMAMTAVANGELLTTWEPGALIALGAVAGPPALLAIGFAQWLVLRRFIPRSGRWIWVNALAWSVALVVFAAVTTPLWHPGQAMVLIVLIGVLGGLLMAATMAGITGLALSGLLTFPAGPENGGRARDGKQVTGVRTGATAERD